MYLARTDKPNGAASTTRDDPLTANMTIAVDPARNRLTYTLAGLFDVEAVKELKRRQIAAFAALRCAPHGHSTMIDISRLRIQSQEVIEMFRAMLADPRYHARRLAIVVGGSSARMQIRRVLDRPTVGYVATVAEAEAWLSSDRVDD